MSLQEEFENIPTTNLQLILIESEEEEDYQACALIRDELKRREKREENKKDNDISKKATTCACSDSNEATEDSCYVYPPLWGSWILKNGIELTFQRHISFFPSYGLQFPQNDVFSYPLNQHNEADVIKMFIVSSLDNNNLIVLKSNLDSFIEKNVMTYKRGDVFEVMLKGSIKKQEEDILLFNYSFTRYPGINTKKELIITQKSTT